MISIEFNKMNFPLPIDKGYFMYSKSNCKFCKFAKEQLPNLTAVNIDEFIETNKSKLLDKISTIATVEIKTFPIVFYNGIYIGGYKESKEHLSMME